MLREHFGPHRIARIEGAPQRGAAESLCARIRVVRFAQRDSKGTDAAVESAHRGHAQTHQFVLKVIAVDINKLKEGFTQIPIRLPISKALENVEALAAKKNVEIAASIADAPCLVNGDELSLSETFVNILGNAIKYSHDGGRIALRVEEDGDEVLISIQDNGIGIPPEDLPHIFEGFYRGRDAQTAATGHGIGLAVSRQIIEAHNGSIAVESDLGRGSTFVVRPASRQAGFESARRSRTGRDGNILTKRDLYECKNNDD